MKLKLIFSIIIVAILTACAHKKEPKIKFYNNNIIILVPRSEKVHFEYKFINTGNDSLKILSADGTFGCAEILFQRLGFRQVKNQKSLLPTTAFLKKMTPALKRF